MWDKALQSRLDRNSTFIALGGGVIGDMCGFAAASYQRGVHFIQVRSRLHVCIGACCCGQYCTFALFACICMALRSAASAMQKRFPPEVNQPCRCMYTRKGKCLGPRCSVPIITSWSFYPFCNQFCSHFLQPHLQLKQSLSASQL